MKSLIVYALLLVAAVMFVGAFVESRDCEAKGGKWLREWGFWSGYKCYQATEMR